MTRPCRPKVFEDPIVADVRKAGDEMAREADYDLHIVCERLREAERQHPERLVNTPPCPRLRR